MSARLFVSSLVPFLVAACSGATPDADPSPSPAGSAGRASTGAVAGGAGAAGVAGAAGASAGAAGVGGGSAGAAGVTGGGAGGASGIAGAPASTNPQPSCAGCFVEVEAGAFHTCARRDDGRVACWGWNDAGQIGAESVHDEVLSAREPWPLVVPGLEGARDLALGYSSSCAALSTGRVVCWGSGRDGLLGSTVACATDPFAACRVLTPREVPSVSDAVEVVSGREHHCARTQTGDVWCWGRNDEGEIGIAASPTNPVQPPTLVPGVAAARLFAKGGVTCALGVDGALVCWGDGVVDCVPTTPTRLDAPSGVVDVVFGADDLCVVTSAGELHCRGANHAGELGPIHAAHSCGKNDAWTDSFVRVGTGVARAVGVGDSVCAADAAGSIACFGAAFGPSSPALVGVLVIPGAVSMRGGAGHVVVVDASGRVGAFGANWYGQLGNGESYDNVNVMDPVWTTVP